MRLRHQLAARKIKVRSQRCQKTTSISNQLENQGYSAGFQASLLLSRVQIITGLFFTWKTLHTHPCDPRRENIPVAEAKLHLTSHFRASPFGYPHLGFCGSTRGTGRWILAAVTAGRMPGNALPSTHSHPSTERWKVWRQSFRCRALPEFPIPPDNSQMCQETKLILASRTEALEEDNKDLVAEEEALRSCMVAPS